MAKVIRCENRISNLTPSTVRHTTHRDFLFYRNMFKGLSMSKIFANKIRKINTVRDHVIYHFRVLAVKEQFS